MTLRRVVIVGCGGIGGHLIPNLCHYVFAERQVVHVVLIDGDAYEARNASRMRFRRPENKAVALGRDMAASFGAILTIEVVPTWITTANVGDLIVSGDVVMLAVDNHATRHLIDTHAATLDTVTVVSGGNDGIEDGARGTCGNVQLLRRREGHALTNGLGTMHPEIATPADRRPDEQGCAALAEAGAPQILFTNLAVASAMLNAFWALLHDAVSYEEVYLDIATNRMQPVVRSVALC